MASVSGVALQGNTFGATGITRGTIALFSIAAVELLAATAVTGVANRLDRRTRLTLLPRRVRRFRNRIAPRPLDVFLAAGGCLIGIDLYLSRPGVAAVLAALCLGAFAVAAVLFGADPDGSADDRWVDRTRVVRETVAGDRTVPGLDGADDRWIDRTRVVREAVADDRGVPGLGGEGRRVRRGDGIGDGDD